MKCGRKNDERWSTTRTGRWVTARQGGPGTIAALRDRLADKKNELAVAKQDESVGKPKSPAKLRATALKDLDAAQKRELLKMLIRRVELTPNSIVLDPFDGDPIVAEVKERRGIRSGRWQFMDVEWLN